MAGGREQAEAGQAEDRPELGYRDHVLHGGPFLQAEVVDDGEERDRERGRELASVEGMREAARGRREERVPGREEGKEGPQVLAEAHRDGGDPAGHDHEKGGPAEEKAPEAPVGLLQELVLPARAREERAQLCVAQGARQRDRAAQGPGEEHQARVREHAGDVGGSDEDRGAEDAADGDERRVHHAQAAVKARLVRGEPLVHGQGERILAESRPEEKRGAW